MIDFSNTDYLKTGNDKQRRAHAVLGKILPLLSDYSPVLVGTIPIAIDIDSSDLDLACCYRDKSEFVNTLIAAFNHRDGFHLQQTTTNGHQTIVSAFSIGGFEVEIFGQPIPVQQQNGYRHMLIEYKILQRKGETFRRQVIALKESGYKTEPAFAHLLGLEGDPYQKLLDYESVLE
ncbi:DUF4269 domain-containing protein [Flavobacterium sp.]|uniref:DUF4269 domain-containing protein n=1 Tax=Flavobacterium sp. TaxID=239 RepID=UPI0039E389AE